MSGSIKTSIAVYMLSPYLLRQSVQVTSAVWSVSMPLYL
jgi:hypothetical protein